MSVVFYPGLHFESEKGHPNFRKTRSPIVENPASVKNGYLRTGSIYGQAISKARLRFPTTHRGTDLRVALPAAAFFISTANDECPGVRLSSSGVLDNGYKYGRNAGALEIEDTLVIPMTRHQLPDTSRALVREKLLAVWNAIP